MLALADGVAFVLEHFDGATATRAASHASRFSGDLARCGVSLVDAARGALRYAIGTVQCLKDEKCTGKFSKLQ